MVVRSSAAVGVTECSVQLESLEEIESSVEEAVDIIMKNGSKRSRAYARNQ